MNGGSVISENILSSLLSGNSMNYLFSTPMPSVSGQVEICAWTELLNDMQNNNDTVCIMTTILSDNMMLSEKEIVRIVDILGRDVFSKKNKILFYIYTDGTVEKKIIYD